MPFPRYWYLGQLAVYFIGSVAFANAGIVNIIFNSENGHVLTGTLQCLCGAAFAVGYALTFQALLVLYRKAP